MATRYVSPPLLDLYGPIDVAVLSGAAPNHHPLGCLLLVLFRQVSEIVYLAL